MAKETTSTPTTFLSINKDGYLYEKSKEPKEGYEEIKLDDGQLTYHKKYTSTDDGKLEYLAIEEREFAKGTVHLLSLSIVNAGGTLDKISIPLYKNNGDLNDYAQNLAVILPSLDYDREINISPSRKMNDRGYLNKFLFFNYTDGAEPKYPKFAHKFGKEGDIPMGVKEKKAGKEVWNNSARDNYLYNILEGEVARFKAHKDTAPKATAATPVQEKVTADTASTATDEAAADDGLPF